MEEVLMLKQGLERAIVQKKNIIFLDETIFLTKDSKLRSWSHQRANIQANF